MAVDIEARNSAAGLCDPVRLGRRVRYRGTPDVNVDIGNFYYWHINPAVSDGQYVVAYKTVIGHVLNSFYHLALSEGSTSHYLNPLRPGGRPTSVHEHRAPVIGVPRIFS